MKFVIKNFSLNQKETDCIIVGIFKSCELTITADNLNQLSNNYIKNILKTGDFRASIGTSLLLYNIPNILSKRVLLVGCGEKKIFNIFSIVKIIKNIIKTLNKYSIKHVIFALTELNIYTNNIYWFIRKIVNSIKNEIFKINTFLKKENYLELVVFHVEKQFLLLSKLALKHALAINLGLIEAKKLSNLPSNICNPLYLSLKAKDLSKKYKNKFTITCLDKNKMYDLGMHAYLAVSSGSNNPPYMSIIKYLNAKNINNKPIVLIGKGVTFDSGGISIKPSKNMHEMKYDMSGAAVVYGILIMAAELNLPLNIIGILAGCENMLDGKSFRPGDIITTMSGKTVEILNTDAEGRLILCDVLTYVKRFSPNIVIDIATLTGACVIALGNDITGLFSNNEDLSKNLEKASYQTNDQVWRLPLFKKYEKHLYSNVADFSNIGSQGAGAITAACFLSKFAKKYNWAHLDIAGTAWNSFNNTGSTGRPVELLSQFLLNMCQIKKN
ncbi:Cytosol aminopeptidase [Buchnera aphidicola (Protaphis terricola)]|uniref:leucyl aminopeptidase n=1 Tax=Buchnera aphidicola TaxID=9 RepID=UPI003463D8A4